MRLAARRVIASATCRASSALPAAAGAIFLVLAAAEAAEAAGASFPALAAAVGGRLPTEPRRLLKSTSGCGAGRVTADWERSRAVAGRRRLDWWLDAAGRRRLNPACGDSIKDLCVSAAFGLRL